MRMILAVCVLLSLSAPALGAVQGEPKKPYQDRPDDKSRSHVETIRQSPQAYAIEFRGTVDGAMTRSPIGYSAYRQGWQPNRSVLIENVGKTDVHNPWIVVNGKRNWRTLEDIVTEAVGQYTEPADRARAIWEYERRQRFHACTWDKECNDTVKVRNVYGYTLCGNEAHLMNDLWKAAGLTTRRGYPIGHCVTEVFYDGAYHLLDADEHVICLKRDNRTIASCEEIVRDHDLVKRTHTYGIGRGDGRKTDEFSASLYWYQGERKGDYGNNTTHTMDVRLRPGESIELRWDHVGKEYSAGSAVTEGQKARDGIGSLARWGPTAYDNLRNGKVRYRPDLSDPVAREGADAVENATFDTEPARIKPTGGEKPGVVTWKFASGWVIVGGKAGATVRLADGAAAQWRFSVNQKDWETVASLADSGTSELVASLDEFVSPRGKPAYAFWLQLVLEGDAAAGDVAFEHDVQTSLLGLPELEVGTNKTVYTDSNENGREVRITHRWLERIAWHPPEAPAEAIAPEDGQTASGSQVTFRWSVPGDPDKSNIADYRFELSEHADMRWPLSPNFEKLISNTPSKGKAEWTVPYTGLLNPDTTYYWHVRARDGTGVWGPWSRTFLFKVQAPGVPPDVKLVPHDQGGFTLQWRANPQGQPPARYKAYGSDEKGFSVSDTEYLVNMGKGFVKTMEEYEGKPAGAADIGMVKTSGNLITTVEGTSLPVVGAELTLPNTNRAYYRVVAVDAADNQSGPSDYAEVPRPFVFTRVAKTAQVGKPYRYEPGVIRSIGDLQCRRSPKSSYNAAFWDREQYTFTPVELPEGLSMDTKTGVISGASSKAGTFDVVFKVANQSGGSREVSYRLSVAE